jgi:hypothetical protein
MVRLRAEVLSKEKGALPVTVARPFCFCPVKLLVIAALVYGEGDVDDCRDVFFERRSIVHA